ncbi:MAG: hypothetical protein UU47_C0017G0009 [candidate division TM6 bacterium GW2011_GWE2_41_16]|nr:MAG: hypothetical protein UU47_C0017G0009 [candidate division TM6 bacterium GW2011_GWE2_41_16]
MKSPLWILNSVLLAVCFCVFLFVAFSPSLVIKTVALLTNQKPLPVTQSVSVPVIPRIYESDLFDTYQRMVAPSIAERKGPLVPIPQPPQPRPVSRPVMPQPEFLQPLNVTLKGIILDNDETDSYAIFSNNATREERLYKAGGLIEDAHIIKIDRDKVMVIRSNGQQETIFISANRLKKDPYLIQNKVWGSVIQKVDEHAYHVDSSAFSGRIKSLANMVSLFDLTTAFDRGKSIGCYIGSQGDTALVEAFGFEPGDIVTHVAGVAVNTTRDRVAAYNTVIKKDLDSSFDVKFKRGDAMFTTAFTITKFKNETDTDSPRAVFAQKGIGAVVSEPSQNDGMLKSTAQNLGAELTRQKGALKATKAELKDAMLNHGGRDQIFSRQPISNP